MISIGYLAKRVALKPDWLNADQVKDIYSVSCCVSDAFCEYIRFWRHNGYWLFDSPEVIYSLAKEEGIDLADTTMFYYEAYEYQYDEEAAEWNLFEPEASFDTDVKIPQQKVLQGFDIVSFHLEQSPECSYLSCNHMAQDLEVNEHCLLASFDEAKKHLESGVFHGCEPGPCRIFAVYSVPDMQ
ncbi:hypothetical protein LHL03_11715 [Pectobacterium carotovorum]|uniref:hypothetical protein n=1 Tax=Pectobacterium carotovorum TaxID=554 RepID=UPI0010FE9EE1|nr:hypothetical protein [Pectobacterium carotovorum]KAA3668191.1 hypothetical protein FEV48_07380 [Pectobacterium carotovorum subsp. carotovorum]UCZ77753.1 hypothetical protein LHL03_11715 [Pectobacterium carotovorum]